MPTHPCSHRPPPTAPDLCQTVVVAPLFSDALAMTATGPNPRIRDMATLPLTDSAPEPSVFGVEHLPELSLGTPLWSEELATLVNFEVIVSHLRDTLLLLRAPDRWAAALVADGEIVEALWADDTGVLVGDEAGRALLDGSTGTLSAHRVDDPRVVAALAVLWPPVVVPAAATPAVEETPAIEEIATPAEEPEYAGAAEPQAVTPETPDIADDQPEPDVLTIPSLSPEPMEMELVAARAAAEFVAPRIDVDFESLRSELTEIAERWLGADDIAPVVAAIAAARPGVDDFVSAIAAVAAVEIPGHESAIVRAMAREMNYRASEVLCGV